MRLSLVSHLRCASTRQPISSGSSARLIPPRLPLRQFYYYHHHHYCYSTMHGAPSSDGGGGNDLIFVRGLNLKATTGVDGWQRPKPQPILLSLWLRTSVALAGSTDHLPYSVHYGHVCKAVTALVEHNTFRSLAALAARVATVALSPPLAGVWVKVRVEKPRALLRADAAGIEIVRRKIAGGGGETGGEEKIVGEGEDRVLVRNLRCVAVLGVNPWEREAPQNVVVNLVLYKPAPAAVVVTARGKKEEGDEGEEKGEKEEEDADHYDFREVARRVTDHVEKSAYLTVEAFVTQVARVACVECGIAKVTVRAEKPSALTFAKAAGVEVTRERSFFVAEEGKRVVGEGEGEGEGRVHDVFLALGSNLGDRLKAIDDAVKELEKRGLRVRRTSSLYESAPMYVTDQPTFLNGACQIETTLSPEELLREVKDIESTLGRIKTYENGPRSIDLDILLYDGLTMKTPALTIPHASMLEREFVLRPLCDIAPNRAHPLTSTAFKHHLAALPPSPTTPLRVFAPLSPALPALNPLSPTRPTHIMAVLNLTPDSFSDGGVHSPSSPSSVVSTVRALLSAGASIIDIGGQSTRPGAESVGAETELARILPAIRALRAAGISAPISVDTYRASVARAAVEAGADIVNDISAGMMDGEMLRTVADLGVPVVLMHMRGTPESMNSLATYGDVVADVRAELAQRVRAALDAGVRRWNILLDPGLGFAKNIQQNLELVRRLHELTAEAEEGKEEGKKEGKKEEEDRRTLSGLPWLLGPSRKRFVGTVTGVEEPAERGWGTAGAVAACVAGGADVVRVHDVREMKMVVDMACAIWRA